MLKTLVRIINEEKEKIKVPKTVQKTIPINKVYPDGIFLSGKKYTKTYRFSDINYRVASDEDKKALFIGYCELLNSFDTTADIIDAIISESSIVFISFLFVTVFLTSI